MYHNSCAWLREDVCYYFDGLNRSACLLAIKTLKTNDLLLHRTASFKKKTGDKRRKKFVDLVARRMIGPEKVVDGEFHQFL